MPIGQSLVGVYFPPVVSGCQTLFIITDSPCYAVPAVQTNPLFSSSLKVGCAAGFHGLAVHYATSGQL